MCVTVQPDAYVRRLNDEAGLLPHWVVQALDLGPSVARPRERRDADCVWRARPERRLTI
jgi:hypothetical protein